MEETNEQGYLRAYELADVQYGTIDAECYAPIHKGKKCGKMSLLTYSNNLQNKELRVFLALEIKKEFELLSSQCIKRCCRCSVYV